MEIKFYLIGFKSLILRIGGEKGDMGNISNYKLYASESDFEP